MQKSVDKDSENSLHNQWEMGLDSLDVAIPPGTSTFKKSLLRLLGSWASHKMAGLSRRIWTELTSGGLEPVYRHTRSTSIGDIWIAFLAKNKKLFQKGRGLWKAPDLSSCSSFGWKVAVDVRWGGQGAPDRDLQSLGILLHCLVAVDSLSRTYSLAH